MGGTALKRKARRNKAKSSKRNHMLKVQAFKPVIGTVDVEAIKKEFATNNSTAKAAKAKTENEEPAKAEVPAPVVEEVTAPKAPAKEKTSKPAKVEKPATKKAEKEEPKAEVKKAAPKAKKEEKLQNKKSSE